MDYYEILAVSTNCSQAELRAAYRKLARQLHPDVNPAPDATERMAEVNAAYSVLKDPAKRFEYDQELEFEKYEAVEFEEGRAWATEVELQPIVCERCGAMNETLSVVGFDYVVSLLVLSWRGRNGGIYCDKCRTKLSLLYTLQVFFLGWWGIPWGPLWSIPALFYNVGGGARPRQPNAELQAYLSGFFASIGQFGLAFASARRSHKLSPTNEMHDFMSSLEALGGERAQPQRSRFWSHSYLLNIAAVASIILGVGVLLSASNPQSNPSPPRPYDSTPRQYANRQALQLEIEALKVKAHGLEDNIASLSSELQSWETEMARIKSEIQSIESRYIAGLLVNEGHYEELREEYNAHVPLYNMRVKRLENLWEQYDSLVDEVNDKVAEYNQGY